MDLNKLIAEENVGGIDLTIRAALGSLSVILLALDLVPGIWRYLVAAIAFIGLFSGMSRHCTPYSLIGFSTAKKK